MSRHPQILQRSHTGLLIVDVQQKINAVMLEPERVVKSIVTLISGFRILQLPIWLTEQYPQGLGPTEPAIVEALGQAQPFQKMTFSCCGSEEVFHALTERSLRQVVLAGIESHVCVLQTALDLLAAGFQIHVPVDAVSSRKELDYRTALTRMSSAGVVLTTVEAVLFELMERAGTAEFKQVARLLK
ncbi:MAG: hydrolase [Calditrichaeota bacterium]|nr:MAG: hydrolase [Calditrichota bacterium]